jgi:hypothetical protein
MFLCFYCSICDSVRCDNGVIFRVWIYVLFLGVLSGTTNLVRITGLPMLRRQECGQVLVRYLLFSKVAKTEI